MFLRGGKSKALMAWLPWSQLSSAEASISPEALLSGTKPGPRRGWKSPPLAFFRQLGPETTPSCQTLHLVTTHPVSLEGTDIKLPAPSQCTWLSGAHEQEWWTLVTVWKQLLFEVEYLPALFIALGLATKSSQTAWARRSLILHQVSGT